MKLSLSPSANSMEKTLNHDHQALVSGALKSFRIIFSSVKKHFAHIESQYGVTSTQFWVLWELSKNPGLRVSELAAKLAIHQSTASNLIEKLVKKSWITKKREDTDQRVVRLFLSPHGEAIINRAPASPRGVLVDALDGMTDAELVSLQQSLAVLVSRIKPKDETDALKLLTDL